MRCTVCGYEMKDTDKFCTKCGAKVVEIYEEYYEEDPVYEEDSVVTEHKKDKKPINKILLVLAPIVVIILIVGISIISSYISTNEMRQALESKDAGYVCSIYMEAQDDEKLIKKYDELLADMLSEAASSLYSYDFDSLAQTEGASAIDVWQETFYGTLLDWDIGDCLSQENEMTFESLRAEMQIVKNYCSGVYALKNTGDYKSAIEKFASIPEGSSKSGAASERMVECATAYMNSAVAQFEKCVAEGNYNEGIEILKSAKEYIESIGMDSSEIQSKIDDALASYAAEYVKKADAAFADKDAETAVGNMEVAVELQPDNAEYKTKLDNYKLYRPFKLYYSSNVLMKRGRSYNYYDSKTANDGSTYENVVTICIDTEERKEVSRYTYNLAGKYDTVSGTVFLPDTNKDRTGKGWFEAYGDGKLIFTSATVTAGVLPDDFEFSVTGVHKLDVVYKSEDSHPAIWSLVAISDFVAQKNFPNG